MGNDEHTTQEAVYFTYWNKKQPFHIVGNDYPLIEEGIIDLNFFKKYGGLSELSKTLRIDYLEPQIKENIKKIICLYQDVFTLPSNPLPCTKLTEHKIILNSGKIINIRLHKLPEKTQRILFGRD